MTLISQERQLNDLDLMLAKGSHKITGKAKHGRLGLMCYVIRAPKACSSTIYVPVVLRPNWAAKYMKGK